MNRSLLLTVAAVLAVLCPAFPQTGRTQTLPDNQPIWVEVTEEIRSDKAKVGDPVKLAVLADVASGAGKVIIPAGARLTGKVTVVTARKKDQPQSRLSIVVEKAEWKDNALALTAFISGRISIPISPFLQVTVVNEGVSIPGYPPPSVKTHVEQPMKPIEDVTVQPVNDPRIVTVLVSAKRDIKLPIGTRMLLRQFAGQPQ